MVALLVELLVLTLYSCCFSWYSVPMTFSEFTVWYRWQRRLTSSALTTTLMVIADLFGVMLSFGAGFFVVNLYDMGIINFKSFVTYWPYLPVFILFFGGHGLYPGISLAPSEELRRFCIGSLLAHICIVLSRVVEDQELDAITAAFVLSCVVSTFLLLVCRSAMRLIMSRTHSGGIPAVIYGAGATGRRLVDRLVSKRWVGYMPAVILDGDSTTGDFYNTIPIIHDINAGPDLVKSFNIRVAIVALDTITPEKMLTLYNDSIAAFRYSILVPSFVGVLNIWMSVRDFDGLLGFATSHRLKMFWNLAIKRFMDIGLVILGGLATIPVTLTLALLVKLTSPGPVLYGHKRIGRNGVTFKMYKFRSMEQNADAKLNALLESDPAIRKEWDDTHKLKDDPRVTPFGKFLRSTSLDELPQLINILRGDMSLVGPRPVTAEEREKYGLDFDRIFSVLPGVSGLWQVSGRSETSYADRVAFDTYYQQSWSIWLDLWVLYKTIGVVINKKGAY
jgi:Undecaprenyl-phosphate galactose phosphotransferase WbaP